MIEDIYGRRGRKMITCDNCEDGFEAESFEDAIYQMKENGWQKVFKEGHYNHYCPDCKEERNERAIRTFKHA
jgi:ribosomal protein L37AE/L43A